MKQQKLMKSLFIGAESQNSNQVPKVINPAMESL